MKKIIGIMVFSFSSFLKSNYKVDLVIFSYNRPMQLYAFLESVEKYITNLDQINVVYRTDDDYFWAYKDLKKKFKSIKFCNQKGPEDFKIITVNTIFDSPSEYVLFSVDDIIVTDFIDINNCVSALNETKAYAFYLKLGFNIVESYMIGIKNPAPNSTLFRDDIYLYQFNQATGEWNYPNTLDMTLYRKEDIKFDLLSLNMTRPGNFEGDWSLISKSDKKGLFFEKSKIINIPLNLSQETGNKNMRSYSTKQLLDKFNDGYKINIDQFYRVNNNSPHMSYLPKFVKR